MCRLRKLRPLASVQRPAPGFRADSTPLLEEERDVGGQALIADRPDPGRVHRARPGAALPAHDHPIDTGEVERADWPNKRFDGQEPDARGRVPEVADPGELRPVLDGDTTPDVARPTAPPVT